MSVVASARLIRSELGKDLQGVEEGILGGVQTFEEYQLLVGKRQGLKRALILVDEVEQRLTEE